MRAAPTTSYEFHLIYQKVHNFCVVDLGGFYLDIIKDRQYTTQADSVRAALGADRDVPHGRGHGALDRADPELSPPRRSGSTFPGQRGESVFLEPGMSMPAVGHTVSSGGTWCRRSGNGSSRCAMPSARSWRAARGRRASAPAWMPRWTSIARRAAAESAAPLEDELRFVLITSYARVHDVDRPARGGDRGGHARAEFGYWRRQQRIPSACAAGIIARMWARTPSIPTVRALRGERRRRRLS